MKSILVMIALLATATAVNAQTPPPLPPQNPPECVRRDKEIAAMLRAAAQLYRQDKTAEAAAIGRKVLDMDPDNSAAIMLIWSAGTKRRQIAYPDAETAQEIVLPCPPTQIQATAPSAQLVPECPFARAMQDAHFAWLRLRAMCGDAKPAGCCQPATAMSDECKGAGCCTEVKVAGCAKGCEAIQPPKTCCCAKACACCETCKAVKAQETVQAEPMMPSMLPCLPPIPAVWQMQRAPGMAPAMPPMAITPPAVCYMAVSMPAKAAPAKLVTPDFEAHCDHMIQRGDSIELIGNVMLLCKKYAQPLRIEGQRILLNLNDGSFAVETGPSMPRMSAPATPVMRPTSSMAPPPCTGASPYAFAPRTEPMADRSKQVIRLRNAPAVDVANAMSKYVKAVNGVYWTTDHPYVELTVVADAPTNSVIIGGLPVELEKLAKIVSQLDKTAQPATERVCPASGVIEVVPVPQVPMTAPRPR